MVEGACVTFSLREFYCHALSPSRLRRQLPPGGSLSYVSIDRKTPPKKKSLVVFVFLSLKMQRRTSVAFFFVCLNLMHAQRVLGLLCGNCGRCVPSLPFGADQAVDRVERDNIDDEQQDHAARIENLVAAHEVVEQIVGRAVAAHEEHIVIVEQVIGQQRAAAKAE